MYRGLTALFAVVFLAGCEIGGAILVTGVATGIAAGAATERLTLEARRNQPVAVIDAAGKPLAPSPGAPSLRIAQGALACRGDVPLRLPASGQ